MDRNDVRIESWYNARNGRASIRVTHVPTGLTAEERQPYPDTARHVRLENLLRELAAKVDGNESNE